jgi:hypothetical protein
VQVKPLSTSSRYNRVLIPDREARSHLRYLCRVHLKKVKEQDKLIYLEEFQRSEHLLDVMSDQSDEVSLFISTFVNNACSPKLLKAMAKVLYLMSGDAALSSALPFALHPHLRELELRVTEEGNLGVLFDKIAHYSKEVVKLVKVAELLEEVDHFTIPVVSFLISIVDKIEYIHSENKPAPPPEPIEGSYNPPSGVSYWFTEHGKQVRHMPCYKVSGTTSKKNFDDPPQVDQACNKTFPSVSRGGYGYIFIWFCPLHGHSYGFHLIHGSEGRKDPFGSLFKYMEEAPKEVFYDFACQLSEYALNREPAFFLFTRFWHDIFHSFPHKCGDNHKSKRVEGLKANTSICEQWNSYLQCIKYTASHLSQEHMVFFVQFMMYLMNKKKTKIFQEQVQIALSGMM